MDFNKYFSQNYLEARTKFRKKTKHLVIEKKTIIDNLTIDCAYFKNKNTKLLLFVSGTHGVEGYTGSAVQLFYIDKYIKNKKYDAAFIHILNPYGFMNNRRYNENNVDLNRNNLENFSNTNKNIDVNKIIKEKDLFEIKKPLVNERLNKIISYSTVLKLVNKFGLAKTIKALGYGQNKYPRGICFTGFKKEKSTVFLEKYISKVTKGYKEVIFIDLHTGAAKKYNLDFFTSNDINTPKFKFIKKIITNLTEINTQKKKGIDHLGGTENAFFKYSKANKNINLVLEYGTKNKYSTILSLNYLSFLLLKENQVTYNGPFEKLKNIRAQMKKAYYPNTQKYNQFVIKKTDEFLKKLINY